MPEKNSVMKKMLSKARFGRVVKAVAQAGKTTKATTKTTGAASRITAAAKATTSTKKVAGTTMAKDAIAKAKTSKIAADKAAKNTAHEKSVAETKRRSAKNTATFSAKPKLESVPKPADVKKAKGPKISNSVLKSALEEAYGIPKATRGRKPKVEAPKVEAPKAETPKPAEAKPKTPATPKKKTTTATSKKKTETKKKADSKKKKEKPMTKEEVKDNAAKWKKRLGIGAIIGGGIGLYAAAKSGKPKKEGWNPPYK